MPMSESSSRWTWGIITTAGLFAGSWTATPAAARTGNSGSDRVGPNKVAMYPKERSSTATAGILFAVVPEVSHPHPWRMDAPVGGVVFACRTMPQGGELVVRLPEFREYRVLRLTGERE